MHEKSSGIRRALHESARHRPSTATVNVRLATLLPCGMRTRGYGEGDGPEVRLQRRGPLTSASRPVDRQGRRRRWSKTTPSRLTLAAIYLHSSTGGRRCRPVTRSRRRGRSASPSPEAADGTSLVRRRRSCSGDAGGARPLSLGRCASATCRGSSSSPSTTTSWKIEQKGTFWYATSSMYIGGTSKEESLRGLAFDQPPGTGGGDRHVLHLQRRGVSTPDLSRWDVSKVSPESPEAYGERAGQPSPTVDARAPSTRARSFSCGAPAGSSPPPQPSKPPKLSRARRQPAAAVGGLPAGARRAECKPGPSTGPPEERGFSQASGDGSRETVDSRRHRCSASGQAHGVRRHGRRRRRLARRARWRRHLAVARDGRLGGAGSPSAPITFTPHAISTCECTPSDVRAARCAGSTATGRGTIQARGERFAEQLTIRQPLTLGRVPRGTNNECLFAAADVAVAARVAAAACSVGDRSPSCAEETVLIYRYIVPRVYLYGGATHFAFRAAISASLTSTVIARDSASTRTRHGWLRRCTNAIEARPDHAEEEGAT